VPGSELSRTLRALRSTQRLATRRSLVPDHARAQLERAARGTGLRLQVGPAKGAGQCFVELAVSPSLPSMPPTMYPPRIRITPTSLASSPPAAARREVIASL
jgi:hypothetical protein